MDKLQEIMNAYADKGYAEVKTEFLNACFNGKKVKVNNFTYHDNELYVCLSNSVCDSYNTIPVSSITEVL